MFCKMIRIVLRSVVRSHQEEFVISVLKKHAFHPFVNKKRLGLSFYAMSERPPSITKIWRIPYSLHKFLKLSYCTLQIYLHYIIGI